MVEHHSGSYFCGHFRMDGVLQGAIPISDEQWQIPVGECSEVSLMPVQCCQAGVGLYPLLSVEGQMLFSRNWATSQRSSPTALHIPGQQMTVSKVGGMETRLGKSGLEVTHITSTHLYWPEISHMAAPVPVLSSPPPQMISLPGSQGAT